MQLVQDAIGWQLGNKNYKNVDLRTHRLNLDQSVWKIKWSKLFFFLYVSHSDLEARDGRVSSGIEDNSHGVSPLLWESNVQSTSIRKPWMASQKMLLARKKPAEKLERAISAVAHMSFK